jgi:GntR family transcriptional regulator/MocR family aminotransferase
LDHSGRVIYIGTFSKVLFPALRLGYLVVPADLVDAFTAARALVDRASPALEQAVLADFIAEGHLARHIRRTRVLYAERQAALVAGARRHLADQLEIEVAAAGLHLVGWLPDGVDDRAVAQRLAEADIEVMPISAYALEALPRSGLVLGYAAFDTNRIEAAVRRMADIMKHLRF